jgi:hypothetical protein
MVKPKQKKIYRNETEFARQPYSIEMARFQRLEMNLWILPWDEPKSKPSSEGVIRSGFHWRFGLLWGVQKKRLPSVDGGLYRKQKMQSNN